MIQWIKNLFGKAETKVITEESLAKDLAESMQKKAVDMLKAEYPGIEHLSLQKGLHMTTADLLVRVRKLEAAINK